jgi:NAD(P)-dependent dehydrogenase (short-subunit alcohol dehydrogenase family)
MGNHPFTLINKNIIITGASSGIGKQTAISCSRMGANLLLIGRDPDRLNSTLKSLDNPKKSLLVAQDLTKYSEIESLLQDAVTKMGKFDGLVNCAGVSVTRPFKMFKPQQTDHLIQTNVISAVSLSRLFIKPEFINKNGGSIIFVSSVMGVVGEIGKSFYSLSKGALLGLTKSLAIELAVRNIRVNSISPGVVNTPMSEKAVYNDLDARKKILENHPLGFGEAEDVANACIFLLADASKWITGTNLIVDGGYTAR